MGRVEQDRERAGATTRFDGQGNSRLETQPSKLRPEGRNSRKEARSGIAELTERLEELAVLALVQRVEEGLQVRHLADHRQDVGRAHHLRTGDTTTQTTNDHTRISSGTARTQVVCEVRFVRGTSEARKRAREDNTASDHEHECEGMRTLSRRVTRSSEMMLDSTCATQRNRAGTSVRASRLMTDTRTSTAHMIPAPTTHAARPECETSPEFHSGKRGGLTV